MTERPDTSMSVRTNAATSTNAPAAMRKVRVATTSKKDAPAPKAPRAAAKNGSKSTSPTRPQSSRGAANKNKTGDDLDKITSGVKKITLVTNKQKQARARESKKPAGTGGDTAADASPGSSLSVTPAEELSSHTELLSANVDTAPEAASPGLPQETPPTPTVDLLDVENRLEVRSLVEASCFRRVCPL